jgi:hypothetical protein
MFRIKSTNIYGESPWSNEIPVQTSELILTSDGTESDSFFNLFLSDLIRFTTITCCIV